LVLVGKTNLSEWANIRSSHPTSGWSARGGQVRNPYALARTPCGSSSGSAVAVAAGYTDVAIGTETDGSIVCPASVNGIVGLKPTLGLVSRAGIIPVSHNQDTAGPMAVDVRHLAQLLTVIAGSDPRDAATAEADSHHVDYEAALDPNALAGARLGVVRKLAGFDPAVDRLLDAAITTLRQAGAVVIDVVLPHSGDLGDDELTVMTTDLKADLDAYLSTRSGVPIHSLADAIAFDRAHAEVEMPWFGQEVFEKAEAAPPPTDPAYLAALARIRRLAGPEGLDAALGKGRLDALIAPTTGVATLIDYLGGDTLTSNSSVPAVAGTPHLTVPMGTVRGLPVGLSFMGAKWSEPRLLALGYAYERLAPARRPPSFPVDVLPSTPR
jgi:amidase